MVKYSWHFNLVAVVFWVALSFGVTGGVSHEAVAQKAAERWLSLVDRGDYRGSWDDAAQLFKQAVGAEDWGKAVATVREPLGEVLKRELMSARYATSLPGAPDGEYVVIQYKTRFTNKKSAVETITPMKQRDGSWRVSGYYVR